MSGHHHHDHDSNPTGPRLRPLPPRWTRRAFLGDIGGRALAVALVTPVVIAGCSSDDEGSAPAGDTESVGDGDGQSLRWERVNLGFVSAYVVARNNRAAIVDTGTEGSAEAIGESLSALGLTYDDVEAVILTHNHGDHIGSIGDVLSMAVNATAYAGEADLAGIEADVLGVVGGEDVFGFEIVATPGHTPGSVAALDRSAGLLIAGDAITVDGGAAAEPPARFTADPGQARASIEDLAELSFNTLLVGHGDPIESSADQSVSELAASL